MLVIPSKSKYNKGGIREILHQKNGRKTEEYMLKQEEKLSAEGYDVLLTLIGKNRDMNGGTDEDDAVKMMIKGRLTPTEEGYRLNYVETDPESGLSQPIRLDMQKGRVSMTRLGPYETLMVFEKDKRFEGRYHTPYGDLNMGIFSTKVLWKVEENKGFVLLHYQLDLQGAFAASHELRLQFVKTTGKKELKAPASEGSGKE